MKFVQRAPEGHQGLIFTRVRAHAMGFIKIHDESCLQEVLNVNLEGARQAESSFARVIHEIGYLDTATCSKARCGRCFVPLPGGPHGFFERLATSVQPEAAKKKRASEDKMTAVWKAPKGHQNMVITWVRAHAQIFH